MPAYNGEELTRVTRRDVADSAEPHTFRVFLLGS